MFGVLLMAGALFMQTGAPVLTPPVTSTTKVDVTVQAPPPDPKAIADASTQSAQAIVVQLVAPTLVKWASDLGNIPDIYRTTPPDLTYNNGAVRGLSQQVLVVAGALVALAVFAVGLSHTLGQHPSFGRLIFAVVMSIGELVFWQMGIDLNNAINSGIAAPDMASITKQNLTLPSLTADPIEAFGPAVLVIVYAVVLLLLLLSLAFRLGLIDILIAVGPLALLCAATEQTQGWSQLYTRLAIGTLFSQVLIVVCLKLAPIIGGLGTGVAGTILGIIVLLLARKMPSLMSTSAGTSNGSGLAMLLLARRLVLRH